MMHNDNVKSFGNIAPHLELKEERIEATKPTRQTFVTETSSHGVSKKKYKWKLLEKGKGVVRH